MAKALSVSDHSRDSAGYTYIYPVLSRRAGGVSIGVNFNPNNACNWRCIYCQVPGLQRGAAPAIDFELLGRELLALLDDLNSGRFYQRFDVPKAYRQVRDIAVSGNGEPTSVEDFDHAIRNLQQILTTAQLPLGLAKVIISNGSLIGHGTVIQGLKRWRSMGGQLWFKLDSATAGGIRRINQTRLTPERVLANLESAAHCCPTWLQTCLFQYDGQPPSPAERQAYLHFLGQIKARAIPIRGVLLYGLARPSRQPQADRLSRLPGPWMEQFAEQIRRFNLTVKLTP